jgi:outer membrane protein OmpA-like peptidoglycan-associated protein
MEQLQKLLEVSKKRVLVTSIALIVFMMLSMTSYAQNYSKLHKKYHHAYYRKNESRLSKACSILKRKRNHIPHKSVFASNRKPRPHISTDSSVVSIDKSQVTADAAKPKPVTKPAAKPAPLPIKPKIEQVSEEKLEKLHKKEDEVLALNHLPVPTSQKHEEVRKRIAAKLASKENVYPLYLEPLYFQFNQDEFSVVDMEPFLMAAEYALQGRTLLIEGHTDSRGQDDFNVKLSIKRVQKIRQLMLDMGVPDDRISVVGYGEEHSQKKDETKSDDDHHQNSRRVDFTIF